MQTHTTTAETHGIPAPGAMQKLCIDCRHSQPRPAQFKGGPLNCTAFVDPVVGTPLECHGVRKDRRQCGPQGSAFVARDAARHVTDGVAQAVDATA